MVTETDPEVLLEQMVNDAKSSPDPSALKVGTVISDGSDEDAPVPMIVNRVEGAGYVTLYDTETGQPSLFNKNALRQALLKKRNGKPAFSPKQLVKPVKGTFKCLLHKDNPERARFDAMGLPVCPAGHLINAFEVELHMKKKHKREWDTLEAERVKRERDEDRATQRAMMESLVGKAQVGTPEAPLYVSDKPKPQRKKRKRG